MKSLATMTQLTRYSYLVAMQARDSFTSHLGCQDVKDLLMLSHIIKMTELDRTNVTAITNRDSIK